MQLYTPTYSTAISPTPPAAADLRGVPAESDPAATIPLYPTKAIRDSYTTSSTPITQSYTATSTAPNGLLPGFYDPVTGEFYQKVVSPVSTIHQPASLVATIQQPKTITTTTATPFQTVAYQLIPKAEPEPKPVPPPKVHSAPAATPSPDAAPVSEVIISDEVREAVAIIKELMEKPAIQKMVTTYQQEGARGLLHWSTIRRGLGLFSDAKVRQSVGELSRLLKSADVQAAIKDPRVVLGKDEALQELLDAFNGMGLIKANDETLETKPKRVAKKPAVVKAEAVSDSDLGEEAVPAEAGSKDLEKLIDELSDDENAPKPARHTHKKQAATEA